VEEPCTWKWSRVELSGSDSAGSRWTMRQGAENRWGLKDHTDREAGNFRHCGSRGEDLACGLDEGRDTVFPSIHPPGAFPP
jgi:hypothetical protein